MIRGFGRRALTSLQQQPADLSAVRRIDLRWHVWMVWLAFALIATSATRTDPDLWGHVKFGLDWLQTRTVPLVDPYSFTQDRPWINHEWLSEAVMAAAYRSGGPAGLVILKMAIVGGTLAIVSWRLRGSTPIVNAAITSVALIAALPVTVTVRPQIWSLLGLALVVGIADPDGRPTFARGAVIAILFAIWANLHGGWITGAGLLTAYAAVRIVRAPRQARRWIVLVVSAGLATLLNPYGIGLWKFLAATVRPSRPDITEWRPFSVQEPPIMWISIIVPLAIAILLTTYRKRRLPVESWIVLLLLVAAGVRVSRVAPLIAPAALVLLAPRIREAWGNVASIAVPTLASAVVFAIPPVVALTAAAAPTARAITCIPINDSWIPDRSAAAYLTGVSGRLWTTFDWGEYAIWHFGPRLRVSIDGRRETVYSDDVVRWHRAFDAGDASAQSRFSAMKPEYVWLRSPSVTARDWLAGHGYRIDVQNEASFIAVRDDVPPLRRADRVLPSCFP